MEEMLAEAFGLRVIKGMLHKGNAHPQGSSVCVSLGGKKKEQEKKKRKRVLADSER